MRLYIKAETFPGRFFTSNIKTPYKFHDHSHTINSLAPLFNITMNTTDPCSGTDIASRLPTLSGGSAAFILVALMLGCLSQPAGSLIVYTQFGAWRLWRLSPLLAGLEGITVILCLIQAPFSKISQRERAFTILAKRTTSTHDEARSLVEVLGRPKLELIVPMMLQIVKLMFITGSKITITLAVMFWLDWVVIQYCHCWVWFSPNSESRPRCKHNTHDRARAGSVCKPDWVGSTALDDNVDWSKRMAKPLGSFVLLITHGGMSCWGLQVVWSEAYVRLPSILDMMLFFFLIGLATFVAMVLFTDSQEQGSIHAAVRIWAVMITFMGLAIYYRFWYDEQGTYKPPWLDWLG